MNLSEYWIGDTVKLKQSGRIGSFEGIHASGKARIKVKDKIILALAQHIDRVEDADKPRPVKLDLENPQSRAQYIAIPDEIDLHIDRLDPNLKNQIPQMIINKQISACKDYVAKAIAAKKTTVTIVHGKGLGQLKLEVNNLIQGIEEVSHTDLLHDGGATRVFFSYK